MRLLGAINLLSSKYSAAFGVNMHSRKASVFRSENLFGNDGHCLTDNMDYGEILDQLVARYVHPEDRSSVLDMLTLERVGSD